ncbi:t121.5 [Tupaiid betaherpesvirus 1]|uniref:T121.5 n=1 Tax=Tupaiid herpesvirus 1 (strain 1) TaxID=10397 RepID=Q91TH5_TUHV1|nr:t121.5 [Tupaiid betaherpesvirus 1]AAK57172.1 t121.5 [Tupaiid betaherpesvirus 1]
MPRAGSGASPTSVWSRLSFVGLTLLFYSARSDDALTDRLQVCQRDDGGVELQCAIANTENLRNISWLRDGALLVTLDPRKPSVTDDGRAEVFRHGNLVVSKLYLPTRNPEGPAETYRCLLRGRKWTVSRTAAVTAHLFPCDLGLRVQTWYAACLVVGATFLLYGVLRQRHPHLDLHGLSLLFLLTRDRVRDDSHQALLPERVPDA